jgi:hypothetical protein
MHQANCHWLTSESIKKGVGHHGVQRPYSESNFDSITSCQHHQAKV